MTCQVFVRHSCCPSGQLFALPKEEIKVSTLKEHISQSLGFHNLVFPANAYIVSNGHKLSDEAIIKDGQYVHIHNRLPGGKGGFGSMLRAIGAQIEKTTNREACRDLSGRRLRDIAEEMRLKKWIAKQAEREQEKAARRREKLERRLVTPRHEFRDAKYDKQRSEISDKVNDALMQGLAVAKSSEKRPGPEIKSASKKPKLWLGVGEEDPSTDEMDTSDSSSSSSSDELTEIPKTPSSDQGGSSRDSAERQTTSKAGYSGGKSELPDAEIVVLPAQSEDPSTSSKASPEAASKSLEPEDTVPETKKLEPIPPEDDSKTHEPEDTLPETKTLKPVWEPFDLNKFNSVDELESLGLDRLKVELASLGMKCGGTLQQRAERLFSVKGLAVDQIKPSLLVKPKK